MTLNSVPPKQSLDKRVVRKICPAKQPEPSAPNPPEPCLPLQLSLPTTAVSFPQPCAQTSQRALPTDGEWDAQRSRSRRNVALHRPLDLRQTFIIIIIMNPTHVHSSATQSGRETTPRRTHAT